MKRDLLALLNEKFGNIEDVQLFARATLLDWRFKIYAFFKDLRTPRRVAKAIDGVSKFPFVLEQSLMPLSINFNHFFPLLFCLTSSVLP